MKRKGRGKPRPAMNMKATFKGVPGERHDSIHMYGQDFPLGEAVTLTSETARRKLEHHPHFEVQGEPGDNADDAKIRSEFSGAAAAALDPIAEAKAAEERSVQEAQRKEANQAAANKGNPRR